MKGSGARRTKGPTFHLPLLGMFWKLLLLPQRRKARVIPTAGLCPPRPVPSLLRITEFLLVVEQG